MFAKYEHCLITLHVTDQRCYTNNELVLKAQISLGATKEGMVEHQRLLREIIFLVDHVSSMQLSNNALEKAKKNRAQAEKHKQKEIQKNRQEEIEKRRQEKLDKEQEKLRKIGPEEQKKYDEKMKKKELKAQQKRVVKTVKY